MHQWSSLLCVPGFPSMGTSASACLLSVGVAAVWLSAAFLPGSRRCTPLFQELQDFCHSCIQILNMPESQLEKVVFRESARKSSVSKEAKGKPMQIYSLACLLLGCSDWATL